MKINRSTFALAFENWHLPKEDTSSFKTFPLPEWNNSKGLYVNTVSLLK